MRIAVAGGTGLIGTMVVEALRANGDVPVVLARSAGVDLTTGEGLAERLAGAAAVIDVTNVRAMSGKKSAAFFTAATASLLDAGARAGVGHHVVLSIVGVDRLDLGYYHGKRRQEELALAGPVPATVLRATQFHEFASQMLAARGPFALAPKMACQPVAAREVADALARIAGLAAMRPGARTGGPAHRVHARHGAPPRRGPRHAPDHHRRQAAGCGRAGDGGRRPAAGRRRPARHADVRPVAGRRGRRMSVARRLAERGLELPEPMKTPGGLELPFPWVRLWPGRAFVSGHGPLRRDGTLTSVLGKVGAEVTEEQAYLAARDTALAVLASLRRALGDLERVTGWLRVFGMVNTAPGFTRTPAVINGFSDLILELWGPEAGSHARSAIGVAALPFGIPVEIEAEVAVD